MRAFFCYGFAAALLLASLSPAPGQDVLRITEFLSVNDGPVTDEDGDFSDWIEVHNAGTNAVSLLDWRLSDRVDLNGAWRFPATNLPPNAYMLVFASGKDRRVPGATLHTDFRLSGSGEYLALIRPDGSNVVSEFAPVYPAQVSGVSYGIALQETTTTLVAEGALAKVLVPANGSLGESWTAPGFADGSWTTVTTGVGFETDGQAPFVPATIANSVTDFSGVQGQANWSYGYWSRIADDDGVYQDANFIPFAANTFSGARWRWPTAEAESELTARGGVPTGVNLAFGRPEHWVIRRYVSEFDGPLRITGTITHTSDWIRVTAVGLGNSPLLYVYMSGLGVGYLDDVKLVAGLTPDAGVNLIQNGDFESTNLQPDWTVSPNLANSSVTTAVKRNGSRSLRLVSTGGGSSQSSSIWQSVPGVVAGQPYALSYWFLPDTNSTPLTVRFSGGWINTTAPPCGDGTVARIFVDGTEVFQERALISSAPYELTVPTRLGSKVDFVIDPGQASDSQCDATEFIANIETSDPSLAVVADSVTDWSVSGEQGAGGWFYGYFDAGTNAVTPTYRATNFVAFPRNNGPHGPGNLWDGSSWDWWNGDPPATEIGRHVMNPNGFNAPPMHWPIRRWISEVSGSITVDWSILKLQASGGGVTARVFHNGVQRDTITLPGTNANTVFRSINISGVSVGDPIDIVVDSAGLGGSFGDGGDRCWVTATIRGRPSLTPYVASSVETAMRNINASAYVRVPFTVTNPAAVQFLNLRMQYDDGFAVYLNGQLVASANAPAGPQWNSAATRSRADGGVMAFDEFNLSAFRGLLQPGVNVLAIHGLNASAADGDFLVLPELTASSLALDPNTRRYFAPPSPGAENGSGGSAVGPLLTEVKHTPHVPADNQDALVTARVAPTFFAVGNVRLIYRVMYSNEVNVAMFDDGAHGDGGAGDGVYGATIPAAASQPGQMVRYYVFALDTSTNSSRVPLFNDPKDSPQYQGFVIPSPGQANSLPVLHTFVQNPVLITNIAGTRCSIAYDDEFYDNVFINLHGQTTAAVFHKRSMNVDLNRGYKFRWSRNAPLVDDFNLLTPIADKAYVRQPLAYETFNNAGVPTHFAFPIRVQQNNAFFGIFNMVEKGDDNFLQRAGLDPNGALYKIYLPLTNAYGGVAEKKTRRDEDNSDLQALIDGLNGASAATLKSFVFDNIDVPEVVNFLATIQLVQNEDCCSFKNYYLYRDSNGSGEWKILPWDLDLVFGRTFGFFQVNGQTINGYFNTNIFWTNAYYSQSRSAYDFIGVSQPVVNALFLTPETYEMFHRRWTSVQEDFLRQSNSHPLLLRLEQRVDELAEQIAPDAVLDFAKWGNWAPTQTMSVAVNILKTEYFARRRGWIFNTLRFANDGPYVGTQPSNTVIHFGAIEFNPPSGKQSQEYLELRNTNNYAADISGWKLGGGVEFTFRGGTVIPAGGTLYVSPDVKAFRARTSGPRGGQGLFVQGGYKGQLSARGEPLTLADQRGRSVRTTNYVGTPSLAQQHLRVTELMYHPSLLTGDTNGADEFEYVELRNTGPVSLNLAGVRFTSGIEFNFTGSAVTNLAAGARVLLVKNAAAFAARYGAVPGVAGVYTGSLENGGERLRLEDATGEEILEFSYNNSWYPITDGDGFSLVIVNDAAAFDTWGLKASWRPSGGETGSPGGGDGLVPAFGLVVVNEVLTHTDLPTVDAVELFNAGTNEVNIRGWFLTDDFSRPKKFRVATDTVIPSGGYRVFTEADFNPAPGSPTSFAFSSLGDEVYLFSGDANTNLTGYVHGFRFGAAANGVSLGRHITSTGEEHFVAQISTSHGAMNAGPLVGPIVINEVMYHPPDLDSGADDSAGEYIELRNPGAVQVALFDAANPLNTWRIDGGASFVFPTNVSLPAGGHLLLVNFDPAETNALNDFRARYNVPGSVPVFGPLSGKLDNSADSIELLRPDAPVLGEVPYILVEALGYRDSAPWPAAADGAGAALRRVGVSQYGNDPAAWRATTPSAGTIGLGSVAPTIVSQPANQSVIGVQTATFTVGATGSAPLRYQWRRNGGNLSGETNSVLTLSNVRLDDAATFSVAVFNGAGSVVSSNAVLSVLFGGYVTTQPTNITLRGSTNLANYGFTTNNARFAVSASGTGPLSYQWRFNGAAIPGATASSLTVSNVAAVNDGLYDVTIADSIGSFRSDTVRLTVLVNPVIVIPPVSVTLVAGATFTASAAVTGNPAAFGFDWRQGAVLRASNTVFGTTDFVTLTAPAALVTNQLWRVIVRNQANPNPGATTTFLVSTLADTDGDGLADDWESLYGLNPGSAVDRNLDLDGDGASNWAEHQAGTNPADAASVLHLDAATAGTQVRLSFDATPGRSYTVEYADDFGMPDWRRWVDFQARTNARTESLLDGTGNTNRYYRVVTPRRP